MSNSKRPTSPGSNRSGTPSSTQAMIAVIAALCVAAVIVIPFLLGGDDDTSSDPGSEPVASNRAPTSVEDVSCEAPPPAPTEPKTFSEAPDPSLAESTTWVATVSTNCGDIQMTLDGATAPQTVASFINLADEDYWNDSPCHRLTTEGAGIFVLQCGDPTGTGGGSPGYGFGIENAPKDGDYPRGTLAMARSTDPNSNGGQFFLVYDDTMLPTDGGGYSIFGEITGGMAIVDAIAAQGVAEGQPDGAPSEPISILSVSVEKA